MKECIRVRFDQSFSDFLKTLPEQVIPAGTQIFQQGDNCSRYFVLIEGRARIFTRSVNGKEVNLYHVEAGGICVLTTACLLSNKAFPAEAVADTELRIRVLSKAKFDELMEQSEQFRSLVFEDFGQRMNGLIGTIQKLALETIEQRLAKYLLMRPDNIITATHKDIASEIGSAREVVSRHLKKFEDQSLVDLGRGQIQILDRKSLLELT